MTKILLVEDDRDVRDTLVGILRALGYDVDVANDGARALTLLRTAPRPALILLDLMMPNMDGYRFLRTQREDPELANIPVIAVTADGRADASELDVVVIRKPFDPDVLFGEISRQCRAPAAP